MTVSGLRRETPRPFVVPPVAVSPARSGVVARLLAGGRAMAAFRLAALGYVAAIGFVVLMAGTYVFVSPTLLGLHTNTVHTFLVLQPVLLATAFVGRLPRVQRRDALVLGVLLLVQGGLAHLSHVAPIVGAFHPVNALVMFWYAMGTAKRTL